jgi:hypothetical protein
VASGMGVFRFLDYKDVFPYHAYMTLVSGYIGLPLIGAAFMVCSLKSRFINT